jgi:hypothetical protein
MHLLHHLSVFTLLYEAWLLSLSPLGFLEGDLSLLHKKSCKHVQSLSCLTIESQENTTKFLHMYNIIFLVDSVSNFECFFVIDPCY